MKTHNIFYFYRLSFIVLAASFFTAFCEFLPLAIFLALVLYKFMSYKYKL